MATLAGAATALALAACSSATGGDALPGAARSPSPTTVAAPAPASPQTPEPAPGPAPSAATPPPAAPSPTASASPATTPPPATTVPGGGSDIAAAVTGEWTGHTRSMDLAPDGTGTISLYSGCCTGEKWTVHWEPAGDTITVTLVEQLDSAGGGLGDLTPGYTYKGALTQPEGTVTALHFVRPGQDLADRDQGYFWCSDRYGYTHYCGA